MRTRKWKTHKKKKKQKQKRKTRYGGAASEKVKADLNITFRKDKDHTYVSALYKGEQVGDAHLYSYDNVMVLDNLQVTANHKGKGIGTRMLHSILEYAFKHPIDKVTLTDLTGSVQFNPTGIPNNMYKKAGFVCSNPGIPYLKNELELTREQYEENKE